MQHAASVIAAILVAPAATYCAFRMLCYPFWLYSQSLGYRERMRFADYGEAIGTAVLVVAAVLGLACGIAVQMLIAGG
jgi:hypothetical protein